ncbi:MULTISPECIES: NAD(P)-dependent alcohol dehydrogenase [Ochrobactrum]|uniref:NAD(P)-dependent alcohol dehydrogenase n=1 Tax=Ochrobactrum quorumnocens TaxID=271865 RepID=A0A5N1JNG0_9HYPH|nr:MULTISPECIES: NAD(P)-dependent alcohol dehydrogenase [Brucella/Ochrobactrum group]KAA9361531.1 NAD(P)-dependent alcohol dehydrogenase [[Ochrobactrum] quorumnocens]MBD7993031.1 NAD(P)-dependent alcohol dehydrogenase [Ochrobactrum gallinarum]MDH7793600.1 putative zinc-type alcohol dehydrogenase-like protein [Ochrobactrum sp. AN78]
MAIARGYAATDADQPLVPFTFERREPNADDVVIAIQYCGVCHSDIHTVRNEWKNAVYPIVPGHEIVGVVTAIGANVSKFKIGDKVGVGCFVDSCVGCATRDLDNEQYLPGLVQTYNTFDRDGVTRTQGGYSDQIVVKEGYVLSMPDNLPLDASAPLLCAGITLYSPLRHWQAGPGKKVAIVGMGGLGHMGVKLATAMGADVTVLSQSLSKKEDGLKLGAKAYYATSDQNTFTTLAGTFDLIICTVGVAIDWNAYLGLLKINGTMVVVGVPEDMVPLHAFSLVPGRKTLAGSMIGSIKETQEMLDFCGKHNIVSEIEMIAMKDINEAYERVLKSDVRYRFVIDMASLDA